jgi:hypothetical protein
VSDPAYSTGLASDHDDAKRMHDAVTLHYHALSTVEIMAGRHIAIRLSDGGSDNTAYDTRQQAIDHQLGVDRNRYLYWKLTPQAPSRRECATILGYARRCYDAGYRPDTAHEGAALIVPNRIEDFL